MADREPAQKHSHVPGLALSIGAQGQVDRVPLKDIRHAVIGVGRGVTNEVELRALWFDLHFSPSAAEICRTQADFLRLICARGIIAAQSRTSNGQSFAFA